MEIRQLTKAELLRFNCLKKERVDVKWNENTIYLGAFINGEPVGVVGCQRLGRHILRYKTDGVLPKWRGIGIYSQLWRAREEMCNTGADVITAYCTKMSLPCYLAHGFKVQSERNGIAFVKRY